MSKSHTCPLSAVTWSGTYDFSLHPSITETVTTCTVSIKVDLENSMVATCANSGSDDILFTFNVNIKTNQPPTYLTPVTLAH